MAPGADVGGEREQPEPSESCGRENAQTLPCGSCFPLPQLSLFSWASRMFLCLDVEEAVFSTRVRSVLGQPSALLCAVPGGPCLPLLPRCRAPSPRGQNRSASLASCPRFLAVGDELILVPTDPWLRQLPAEVTVRWLSCCLCLPVSSLNRCRWGESLWCANTAPQRVPASRAPQGQHCPSASSGASWKFPWPSSAL